MIVKMLVWCWCDIDAMILHLFLFLSEKVLLLCLQRRVSLGKCQLFCKEYWVHLMILFCIFLYIHTHIMCCSASASGSAKNIELIPWFAWLLTVGWFFYFLLIFKWLCKEYWVYDKVCLDLKFSLISLISKLFWNEYWLNLFFLWFSSSFLFHLITFLQNISRHYNVLSKFSRNNLSRFSLVCKWN